jgi:ankyrin repeat protein
VAARESWRGQTALMWAAAQNHARAVHTLIELGARVDERSAAGWSALLFAVRAGQAGAVDALLAAGADVNDTIRPLSAEAAPGRGVGGPAGTSALVIAVTNGHFSLAKHLVERGADPNAAEQGWTALHQLSYTRRPNSGKGMPPVRLLDSLGTLEFARFLLENGADPDLRQTRRFNNRERNNLNRVGGTAYLLAAKHADVPLMQLLADHGADTRMPTEGNASPLMVAAGVGIFNVGESAGTNEEAFDAVQLAWELGDRSVLEADDRGYTALHGAALRGANPIVEFLVDRGADLLAESREGWTPLRIADGVHYTGTVKRADHTAELLRRIMQDRGVYDAEKHRKDVNSVAVVKPAGQ